ncbi:MAG: T9SS type A sorting domain-containing protein [Paludibacteraceae bacterium]|nr:T9SS type A sorting domain-containing protein [Paludibacteraceae bacterium]
MKNNLRKAFTFLLLILLNISHTMSATKQMEYLDRGVVAVKTANGVFVSWRFLGTDAASTSFNLYRDGVKVNNTPIGDKTNYVDAAGTQNSQYTVKAVKDGKETDASIATPVWAEQYKTLTLKRPTANGCTYTPNDMSVGDVDGDGQYELFVKWDPSNSKDNSQSGVTDKVYIDCYRLDGTFLWRIDLGVNIRAGAHYTQFQVYDFDGDGKAEMVCKTAPGTIDGKGKYVVMGNDDPSRNYRNSSGYILDGPEYLTIFEGATGSQINTVAFNPGRGNISNKSTWGDNYGNRCDRYLACTAYLDGVHPSVVMCRGYYTQSNLVAYDFKGGKLVQRWEHHSTTSGQGAYGEGFHNLTSADVDGDGYDEIIYGSACIDHDGKLFYRTGLGHGDAMHVSQMDPSTTDLLGWFVHEETSSAYGYELRNLRTGKVVFGEKLGKDVGRGLAADIDASHPGFECWSTGNNNVYDIKGNIISTKRPSINFRIYWDGDLQDELLDGTTITKWNGNGTSTLITLKGSSINSTKANPCLSADIFGDWREEVITYNTDDPSQIFIYTTIIESKYRLFTPMHDAVYRCGVAWQNTAYNQPPHLSFYIGDGVEKVKQPDIAVVGNSPVARDTATIGRKGSGGARNQTIVVGQPMTSTIYTYTNADRLQVLGNLPKGVTATDVNGTLTIAGTPSMVGTYSYTLQTEGPNVNVEGPGGTLTIIPDSTDLRKKVAYITDATNANYANDQVLLPALKASNNLYVTEVDAQQKYVDFSMYDMVIISEITPSNAPIMMSLKGLNKPMLNMKVHVYKTSEGTWNWATSGYGDDATATSLVVTGDPSHPIFKNVNIDNGEIALLTNVNTKGFTYMNPENFTSVEGKITPLASIKGTENVCIFEAEPGAVIAGTPLNEKYIQIGINGSSIGLVSDEAVTLVENACRYLLNDYTASEIMRKTPRLTVTPNPVEDQIEIIYQSEKEGKTAIRLTNILGELVQNTIFDAEVGSNRFNLRRGDLPAGIYMLNIGKEQIKLLFK